MLRTYTFQFLALCAAIASGWPSTATIKRHFDGFDTLEKLVVFGDSYSRIGFSATGDQPSLSNPLGNFATTSSGGDNWVKFLTLKYNESAFLTYDYALSGATVNVSIIEGSVGRDIVGEAETFLSSYGGNKTFEGYSNIYAFWIGINDVNKSYLGEDYAGVDLDIYDAVINSYYAVISELYDAGARDFLFLTVPPLEKAPTVSQSSSNSTKYPLMQRAVADYNEKVTTMARQVRHDFAYTSVFVYDVHALFNSVLADPSQYAETASIKDTTTYCSDYASIVNNPDYSSDNCSYPLDGYFWINNLHPTWPVHQLLAKEISTLLASGKSI